MGEENQGLGHPETMAGYVPRLCKTVGFLPMFVASTQRHDLPIPDLALPSSGAIGAIPGPSDAISQRREPWQFRFGLLEL